MDQTKLIDDSILESEQSAIGSSHSPDEPDTSLSITSIPSTDTITNTTTTITSQPYPYILFYDHVVSSTNPVHLAIFSHWFPSLFTDPLIPGLTFPTAEHYMMYHKALLFDPPCAKLVMKSVDPEHAKKVGRALKGFDREIWNKLDEKIVERANWLKFGGGLDLDKDKLKILVEKEEKKKKTRRKMKEVELKESSKLKVKSTLIEGEEEKKVGILKDTKGTSLKEINEKIDDVYNRLSILLSTRGKILVEASPEDRKWGVGFSVTEAPGREDDWGSNKMGKALTRARDRLIVQLDL